MMSAVRHIGTVPEDWNTAVVCPVLKKWVPTKTKNTEQYFLL